MTDIRVDAVFQNMEEAEKTGLHKAITDRKFSTIPGKGDFLEIANTNNDIRRFEIMRRSFFLGYEGATIAILWLRDEGTRDYIDLAAQAQ